MALFNYECDEVKHIIEEVSPNYPQLTTYEKEWLYFHKYGYIPGVPVELEYETVNVNPNASVFNAIPFQYKSAILKGNTDENFQSVQMPVLKTTGKNLFDGKLEYGLLNGNNGLPINSNDYVRTQDFIPINCERIAFTVINEQCGLYFCFYDKDKNFISKKTIIKVSDDLSIPEGAAYLKFRTYPLSNESVASNLNTQIQIEEGTATSYEPYKSNILTVNEDLTLRSNGNVYDELNLLTGHLTQRIGENNEVLSQEVVKTVDLTPLNKPYEGTNHYELTSNIPCEVILEVPVVSTGKQTLEEINN